jgi:hypothetical protein
MKGHLQDFCQVQGAAGCELGDLFAATEAVGDDEAVGRRIAYGGQEFELSDGGGDFVFVVFEAEGAGHTAATGSRGLEVDAQAVQERFFGGHLHEGFVMAVAVKQGAAVHAREWDLMVFQEFAE